MEKIIAQANDFCKQNGLLLRDIDSSVLLRDFAGEMAAGLTGKPLSLLMIPAYLSPDGTFPANKPVIVIDAGGTNLRVALVSFDDAGAPRITRLSRHRMPGSEGPISGAAFYNTLADYVLPLTDSASAIGFCFSYPAEILPNGDARLVRWTKQIAVPEVVGTLIGSGLRKTLAARGRQTHLTVLNDTVATLLAGRSMGMTRRYSSYVGFILGTGTNTAYVERHAALAQKVSGLSRDGRMIINVESGNFALAPRSRFDELFDATTNDPGCYLFEKMIAGAYLGGLGLTVLRAAAQAGIFSGPTSAALRSLPTLGNKDFDDFCHNPFITSGALAALPLTDADRRAIITLGTPLFARAALFAAVNIATAVIKTGAGHDPLHPVGVTIDGSTFYRTLTASLKSRTEEHLRRILGARGIHYQLIQVDEAPVIGAAIAGLSLA